MILHASCIDIDGRGILILGESGSGKSTLAIQLIALGASLVADDKTLVTRVENHVIARCPAAIKGLIEARGIGFLKPKLVQETRLHLIIDLNQRETSRLPEQKYHDLFGVKLSLIYPTQMDGFASAVYILAQSGLAQDHNLSDVNS